MEIILKFFQSLELTTPLHLLALSTAIFFSAFLYWRAGRHELYDSNFLLDLGFFSVFGGLIFGRLFAFIFDFESFNFSLYKLIFFHIFPGFNYWGFLTGILFFGFLMLRKKKEQVWSIFDFVVPAIVFSSLLLNLFNFLISYLLKAHFSLVALGGFVFNAFLFLTLKRLSTKKRYKGFFGGIYFLATGSFYAILALVEVSGKFDFRLPKLIEIFLPLTYAIFGGVLVYRFSKRNFSEDLKGFFAFILLNLFNFKRAVTSMDEAGRIAKSLIFLPYFIFSLVLVLLRMLTRELSRALWEFLYILGLKKY